MRVLILLCLAAGIAQASEVRVATGYRKGRATKLRLIQIDWHEVEIRTARAFERMKAAAAKAGVALQIRSGFRSNERQALLYRRWLAGTGNRAARPGYSNHQSGRALDLVIVEAKTFYWLDKHARTYGFRRTVRDEPWHWEYFPRRRATGTASR